MNASTTTVKIDADVRPALAAIAKLQAAQDAVVDSLAALADLGRALGGPDVDAALERCRSTRAAAREALDKAAASVAEDTEFVPASGGVIKPGTTYLVGES